MNAIQTTNQVAQETVDQKNFSAKYATKAEVYRFLATECEVYLPHYQTVTIWHMKDIAGGTKIVSTSSSHHDSLGHLLRQSQGHRHPPVRGPHAGRHPGLRPLLPGGR